MKKVSIFLTLFLLMLFSSRKMYSVTCIALANGSWTNAAVWSCGAVPNCGDSIVIPAGITVSNTTQQDYSGCALPMKLTIGGTLLFSTGFKLKLPCNSKITVATGGAIMAGGGGGASNYIQICGATVWDAGDGDYSGPACLPPTPCNASVLPVYVSSFDAEAITESEIRLKWTTESEKNNQKFEIERSNDASSFTKIASIGSKALGGNSYTRIEYEYIDGQLSPGTHYYRLKQFDQDQKTYYTQILTVVLNKENKIQFSIFPNPNKGEFTADISGIENNHQVTILLHDVQGRLVYKNNFFIQDPHNSKFNILPEEKLTNGMYTCTLLVEEIAFSVKVIVN